LAVAMVDNPMVPATGHRICNDCMKGCIYQKQEPVDISQIETRCLTDVLDLPWGVEIYDLLTRWNPLRAKQYLPKSYNGRKVLIAGMGPAGFTLAHHLTMEGCAVVGIDGLKIEPLPEDLIKAPLRDYHALEEALDSRIMTGFGGVAEYGITVRWDKNFLKLIYLTLLRRPLFQVFGGVRLGGTVTLDDAWRLGFGHVSIATGAGLPKVVPMGNSLARGMRQANDFLMALQLTGASKAASLTNLQVRLPAVVIGGGLTAIDTATEA
ncbi:MAG: FAD-dependent oxidoreductase, partial [Gammaproteobacteria bacterium]|nr:FAD-dependent oxidoreductase [Gammaproteobacteria bacterium]